MQRITLLCVGKLKEKFYIEAAAEYLKRLSRFCKLDLVELYMSLSVPVRKSAHIIEFGGFNVTLLFALYVWGMRGKPWVRQAFLLTFLYACSDELHPIFVPGRAGRVSDVIIDMLGVCVLALFLRAMITRRERRFAIPA